MHPIQVEHGGPAQPRSTEKLLFGLGRIGNEAELAPFLMPTPSHLRSPSTLWNRPYTARGGAWRRKVTSWRRTSPPASTSRPASIFAGFSPVSRPLLLSTLRRAQARATFSIVEDRHPHDPLLLHLHAPHGLA